MDVPAYYIRQKSSRVTNSMPPSTGFHRPPALCKIKSTLFLVHRFVYVSLSEACRNDNAGFLFCQEIFYGPLCGPGSEGSEGSKGSKGGGGGSAYGGHFVARVQRVQKVLPAFGRRVQRVVVSPYRAMSLYAVEVLHRTFKSVEAGP